MSRDVNVLGVYFGHNASVALARNGKLIFALSEERLRRIKNFTGFPRQAYRTLLETCVEGDRSRIDLVVFPSGTNGEYHYFLHTGQFRSGRYVDYYHKTERNRVPELFTAGDRAAFDEHIRKDLQEVDRINRDESLREEALARYEQELGIDRSRFAFIDHHRAHACSACFNLRRPPFLPPQPNASFRTTTGGQGAPISGGKGLAHDAPWLVFTLDASGDNVCATVNRFEGGRLSVLSSNLRYPSLGTFYREVTAFLGMKPCEHEFKVMGLAPYAKDHDVERVRRKFEPLFWLDDNLEFRSAFPAEFTKYFLLQECVYDRFDTVAGAAQAFIEARVTEWIRGWIARTGIQRIAVAGGVFMNVKLNQRVCECPEVDELFVVPSAADESTAIGCCYHGAVQLLGPEQIVPVRDLYLGPESGSGAVEHALEALGCFEDFEVQRVADIDEAVAELLASGEVVGRVAGRSEWGARALGNRSLLADPRNADTIRVINEMIKGRDFWMPFTPSILAEDLDRYIVNPKRVFAPYMVITFDSTPLAREHLPAALHPYDFTIRPQAVMQEWNPGYYRLLRRFKELTGVSGVLNTSLNLHGEPTVQTAEDAVRVLRHSGLRHIAIGDWLISKKVEAEAEAWRPAREELVGAGAGESKR